MKFSESDKQELDSIRHFARVLEPFRSRQWPLLVLLAHDKKVMDLATTNPVLAYVVAEWYGDYPRSLLDFGGMSQRALLKLLKLPDSAALVKLFRKIPPESVDHRLWKPLLTALGRPDGNSSKLLSHIPSINLGVMELILTPRVRPLLTPALLEEVAADPKEKYRGAVAAIICDTLAMRDELEDERPLSVLTSVTRLRQLHSELSSDFQSLETLRKAHGALPLPPLPGIKGKIVPLRT